jgi:uncharacterized protein YggE
MGRIRHGVIVTAVVLGLLVLGGLISNLAQNGGSGDQAAAETTSNMKAITVNGEGRVLVKPDTAQIIVGVEIRNTDLSAAQNEASQKMNAVIDSLKQNGVEESKIKTINYSISIDRKNDGSVNGYVITNLVQARVKPIDKVGPILDAAVKAGANSVQSVSFVVEDVDAATQQARQQAVNDARDKAQQLAKLAGVTLGAPISITEASSPSPSPVPLAAKAAGAVASDAAAPIQAGESEIVVYVTVSYGI